MNRRDAIGAALKAGLASALPSPQPSRSQGTANSPESCCVPDHLIGERATSEYFSEARLHEALGTSVLLRPDKVQVVAFNFPSWHTSPYLESVFGKGWTEYDTLRNSRSLFPGHSMPHFPLWGYYDESDVTWAEKEVDLAATYGVDAWMIDWYWHSGTQFYHEQLERGLLKASNRSKLKFAVMWANHDWKNVYPARSPDEAAILLPQVHSFADFEHVANYCAEHYFSQDNYLKIQGVPVFGLFDALKVIQQLGEDGLKRSLNIIRERCQKLGIGKVHLQVCNGVEPHEAKLAEYGFDSCTLYGTFAWTYGGKRPGSRIPYGVGATEAIAIWKEKKTKSSVPFYPTCSVGWDDSPRFGYFSSVAIDRTPDQFERLLRAALHFVGKDKDPTHIYIGAWNEWTEDSVLLPDSYWGYSYLEAVRRAVRVAT